MKCFFTIVFILSGIIVNAQEKSSSIGLRGGGLSGMSIKLVDYDLNAMEIIIGYQKRGMRMTGLVQKLRPIKTDRIANLYIISGFGAHAGYVKYNQQKTKIVDGIEYYSQRKVYAPIIGADILIGIEYHFETVPFNISIDYKPYIEFFGERIFRMDFWDIGFSLRYRLTN